MISALIGNSDQVVYFTEPVLAHFSHHRQLRVWHREAGGLLFARINGNEIVIEEATGPRAADRRSRYAYQGDRFSEQREIDQRFARGLHYVGDWHTHPERCPRPSGADDLAMISRVKGSTHQLLGLLFVIIGTAAFPDALALAVHDGKRRLDLKPAVEPATA